MKKTMSCWCIVLSTILSTFSPLDIMADDEGQNDGFYKENIHNYQKGAYGKYDSEGNLKNIPDTDSPNRTTGSYRYRPSGEKAIELSKHAWSAQGFKEAGEMHRTAAEQAGSNPKTAHTQDYHTMRGEVDTMLSNSSDEHRDLTTRARSAGQRADEPPYQREVKDVTVDKNGTVTNHYSMKEPMRPSTLEQMDYHQQAIGAYQGLKEHIKEKKENSKISDTEKKALSHQSDEADEEIRHHTAMIRNGITSKEVESDLVKDAKTSSKLADELSKKARNTTNPTVHAKAQQANETALSKNRGLSAHLSLRQKAIEESDSSGTHDKSSSSHLANVRKMNAKANTRIKTHEENLDRILQRKGGKKN